MKKLSATLLTLIFLLVFSIPVSANPAESDSHGLEPFKDASTKSESEIDGYLKQMGFTDEELGFTPLELKKDIASNGGTKIKIEELDPEVVIKDENGKTVAPSDKISTQDVKDGIFKMYGYAFKLESPNSRENAYHVYASYNWERGPLAYYTDTLAMAWQSKVTPYRSPYSVHNWRSGSHLYQYENQLQKQQIEGDAFEVDVLGYPDPQDGFARQEVRAPKSLTGQTGAVEIAYAHKTIPGVALAILNYFSIDFSGAGQQEYQDRFNFTY
ncbi:hypothetical protein ACU1JV_15220 [Paenibacillus sp. T2-29]|uniref:hypothetical protein n=1 Tax=Paenibacillus TaxID=44249 RepID=UPI0039BCB93F